ncbi:hypothetical protein EMIHUDRAFT_222486 [Emiliania huxleyi CCMP1516]|uniref:ER lumen protein-retaining receptor n=2 Tax=Emiliania huxleyi TaxID=2903 RepID=A0A0D3KY90_EMIH1|nr:hypothetical protein EMIHUDRAFT_222486 [Emiliania huxleyi CCMP1516]EOD40725.1 hypothetical protein EMIHUDRAFT_222486 [Emiliania huxleyi CCMP1516]|eukprot:XP_005793154.1 hypothetical protein EMIHUDRAFT_222486 [Emiliania huxleyi CCMP1516]
MVAMNVFRLLGDTSHLLSFIVMFWKLFTSKSVAGISLKTQLLYVIVFCFRYLDIFWNFLSIYNTIMKVIFISSSVAVVYVMKFGVPHKDTYSQEDDAFPIAYLAVAILPQLFMLQKQGGAEATLRGERAASAARPPSPLVAGHYILLLGLYRLFYILNWIYRYATEPHYMQLIVWISGTALYLDFFYTYMKSKRERGIDAPIEIDSV